ncbi:MAG: P22 coat protein - protein 5 domain protein [Clostridia bacterium]|nr:P22 coat protein - protein 5 domain protein [Clostridia bacterium]
MAISNFIPTVWSENLYTQLDKKYIAVRHCNREFEGDIKEKGSMVNIVGVGDVSVFDYTKDTDMSEPQALSDTLRTLSINQAKAFNFQIDDIDRAQCTPKLMNEAMKIAASALANAADAHVFSLFTGAGSTINEAETTAANIIDHLIDARTRLFANNVSDASDIVIEVSPAVAALILKAKIELSTDNADALDNGCIGSIGGCKIYVSNNIASSDIDGTVFYKCLARTKRAIAFAEQLSEINAYRPEKRFADAVKGLHLYGAKVVYPNEMVLLNLGVVSA